MPRLIDGGEGVSESQTISATKAQPRVTKKGRSLMRRFYKFGVRALNLLTLR